MKQSTKNKKNDQNALLGIKAWAWFVNYVPDLNFSVFFGFGKDPLSRELEKPETE